MPKRKVSATLSPDRVQRAIEVTGRTNLSELLDDALDALVERELEQQWLAGHRAEPSGASGADLPQDVAVDLSSIPWEDE